MRVAKASSSWPRKTRSCWLLPRSAWVNPTNPMPADRSAGRVCAINLIVEIRELSRSRPYNTLSQESQEIIRVLIASGEHEKQRLDDIVGRVADAAAIIPMDRDVIRAAIRVGIDRGLSPQDAIVYASVLAHMANAPGEARCFLTKNSRDFEDPDIQNDLLANNCKLLTKFRDGLGYIQSLLP